MRHHGTGSLSLNGVVLLDQVGYEIVEGQRGIMKTTDGRLNIGDAVGRQLMSTPGINSPNAKLILTLENDDTAARTRQVGGGDQRVVPTAHHHDVMAIGGTRRGVAHALHGTA